MAVSARIQQIYLALFGRPADPVGGEFYDSLTHDGANLDPILTGASRLSGSDEYLSRFTGLTSVEIVNTIFISLFGHPADLAGLTFYVQALANGDAKSHGMPLPFPAVPAYTIEQIAVGILDGATGTDADIVDNKTAAAVEFTDSLDTPEEIAAYAGDDAAALGRDFISGVTADPTSVPDQAGVDAAIQNIIDNGQVGISINLTENVDVVNLNAPAPLTATDHNDVIYGVITGGGNSTLNTGDNINGAGGMDTLDVISTSNNSRLVTLNSVEQVRVQSVGSDTTLDATNWTGVQKIVLHDSANDDLNIDNLGAPANFVFLNNDAGGGTTTIDVDFKDGVLGTDATLDVTVSNSDNAELDVDTGGGDAITGLHITAIGDDNALDFTGAGSDAEHLTHVIVDGTGDLSFEADSFSDLDTFDASANSGGVTVDLSSTDQDLTAMGGSGNDSFEIDFDHKVTATMGDGNDRVEVDDISGFAGSSLDGGAGTQDILGFDSAQDAEDASSNGDFEAIMSNFERVGIDEHIGDGDVIDINLANLDDINYVQSAGTETHINQVRQYDVNSGSADFGQFKITFNLPGNPSVTIELNHDASSSSNVRDAIVQAFNDGKFDAIPQIVSIYGNPGDSDNFFVELDPAQGPLPPGALFSIADSPFVINETANETTTGVDPINEVQTIIITTAPSTNGNITITLDPGGTGPHHDQAVPIGLIGGETTIETAARIADALNGLNGMVVSNNGTNQVTITFPASDGNVNQVTYNAGATTSAATTGTTTNGQAPSATIQDYVFTVGNSTVDGRIAIEGVQIDVPAGTNNEGLAALIIDHLSEISAASNANDGEPIDSITYNSGTNTLTVHYAASAGNADLLDVELDNDADVTTSFTGSGFVGGQAGGTLNLNYVEGGGTLELTDNNNGVTNVYLDTQTTSDSFTVILDDGVGNHAGVLNLDGIESVTVNQMDADGSEFAVSAPNATSLTVSGVGGVHFDNNPGVDGSGSLHSDFSKVVTFDASGVTGTGDAGGVWVDLTNHDASVTATGGEGNDHIRVESGADHGATIDGGNGDDNLWGGEGADTINGGDGNDYILANGGADQLTGGAGSDTFSLWVPMDSSGVGSDTITDFVSGTDTIDLFNLTYAHDSLAVGQTLANFDYRGEVNGYGQVLTALDSTHVNSYAVLDLSTHTLYIDVNHDGQLNDADVSINLTGVSSLTDNDFNTAP